MNINQVKNLSMACGLLLATAGFTQAAAAQQETYDGIPVGFTEEGYPYIGEPDAAVTIEEWSDYLCPFCNRHFQSTLPALKEQYVRAGKLRIVFRDFPLASLHPTAAQGHETAMCVAEQGAEKYWTVHNALFTRQQEWNRLPDPAEFLAGVAEQAGTDMTAWQACMAKGDIKQFVSKSVEEGKAIGFNGTPSFRFVTANGDKSYNLIGAQPLAQFAKLADPLIIGEEPPEEIAPKPPELPLWAKPEGLAPDPDRPGYNLAGDAYKGDPEAPLVVIEFSDFLCPACQSHVLETQPDIDKALVDTGKVLWVSKQFPLRIHPYANLGAVAAACAGRQNEFWTMHHALFDTSDQWAKDDFEKPDVEQSLIELAEKNGLNMESFLECFNSREGLEYVLKDLYDAQGIVQSTPTFIIIQDGKGTMLRRPMPAEQFVGLLTGRLKAEESKEQQAKIDDKESS